MPFDSPEFSGVNETANSLMSDAAEGLGSLARGLGFNDEAEYLEFHALKFDDKAAKMAEITVWRDTKELFGEKKTADKAEDVVGIAGYHPEQASIYVADLVLNDEIYNVDNATLIDINNNLDDGVRRIHSECRNNPDLEEGEAYTLANARARDVYDMANEAPTIRDENFRIAMQELESGRGPQPRIAGLPHEMQQELYDYYMERGGNTINWMIAVPESKVASAEDMDVMGSYLTESIRDDAWDAHRFRHVLLGPDGLITNKKLPAVHVAGIADAYIPYIEQTGFDYGTIGYDLLNALSIRNEFRGDTKDVEATFQEMEEAYKARRKRVVKPS